MRVFELDNKDPNESSLRSRASAIWSMRDAISFSSPFRIQSWSPIDVIVSPNIDGEFEDFPETTDSTLIVSKRAQQFLEVHCAKHLQFLPLNSLSRSRGPIESEYFLMIVLSALDCLDYARSVSRSDSGWLVTSVIVDPDKVPVDPAIFRPVGYHTKAIVNEALKRGITEVGLTGPRFYDVATSDSKFVPKQEVVPDEAIKYIREKWKRLPRYTPL